jgi:hypothetical protein
LYWAVHPGKDHQAEIRTVGKSVKEEIDGQILNHIPEHEFDSEPVATAAVWTDTHITRTRA